MLRGCVSCRYVFGSEMNLLQVAETFCQSCEFEGVIEAIEVLAQFVDVLGDLGTFAAGMTYDGCDIGVSVRNFTLHFATSSASSSHSLSPSSSLWSSRSSSSPSPSPSVESFGGVAIAWPDTNIPSTDLVYSSSSAKADEGVVTNVWAGLTTSGSFGFKFNMLDDLPGSLVKLMVGLNFPVVGITMPSVTVGALAQWSIPICVFAQVRLGGRASEWVRE
jgi:hypothetical protein